MIGLYLDTKDYESWQPMESKEEAKDTLTDQMDSHSLFEKDDQLREGLINLFLESGSSEDEPLPLQRVQGTWDEEVVRILVEGGSLERAENEYTITDPDSLRNLLSLCVAEHANTMVQAANDGNRRVLGALKEYLDDESEEGPPGFLEQLKWLSMLRTEELLMREAEVLAQLTRTSLGLQALLELADEGALPMQRSVVARALGLCEIEDTIVSRELIRMTRQEEEIVQRQAVLSLGRLSGSDEKTWKNLEQLLKDPDYKVKALAVTAIAEAAKTRKEAIVSLRRIVLSYRDRDIREHTIGAIQELAAVNPQLFHLIVKAYRNAWIREEKAFEVFSKLADKEPKARKLAAEILEKHKKEDLYVYYEKRRKWLGE